MSSSASLVYTLNLAKWGLANLRFLKFALLKKVQKFIAKFALIKANSYTDNPI